MGIRVKLLLGFSVVALMSLVVGIVGLQNMGKINESTDIMYENELLGLSYLNEAQISALMAVRAEKNFILSSTIEDRNSYKEAWEDITQQIAEYLNKAEECFATEEGQKVIKDAYDQYNEWLPASRQVITLGSAEQLAAASGASDLSMGEGQALYAEFEAAVEYATDRKEKNAKVKADEATELYNASVFMMVIVIVSSLALGILIGIYLSGSLLKTVGGEPADIEEIANKVASGNLTIDTSAVKKATGIKKSILIMTNNLRDIVLDIQTATSQVASGSEQISTSSQGLSQGATEQAAGAEEVSSSVEEMSATIKQNLDNSMVTDNIASQAAKDAEEGGEAVSRSVTAIKEISGKIGIIEEIARQTNLLALNAAIEAARAGDAGKGFAVVASEVRKLAERSQKAAGEITELSDTTVNQSIKAGEIIETLVPNIKKTADLVQEITAASKEQSSGTEQIGKAMIQLDSVIQQNASVSEELASMAEELSGQAMQLSETISYFKVDNKTEEKAQKQKANQKTINKAVPKKESNIPENKANNNVRAIALAEEVTNIDDDKDFEEF